MSREMIIFYFLLAITSSIAYMPYPRGVKTIRHTPHLMTGNEVSLVPVDKVNIENAAAVTSGIFGFFLAGPVVALILAAIANYVR